MEIENFKKIDQKKYFSYFDQFMNHSYNGIRTLKNGQRVKSKTVDNYQYTKKLLQQFSVVKQFDISIILLNKISSKTIIHAKNHAQKFYNHFVDFLYDDKGYFDNYVGQTIKNIRSFYNYLNHEQHLNIGTFHKSFFVPKEDIPIIALTPEQLHYLMTNENLNDSLDASLKIIKDIFVFGCTVGLRVSDLLALRDYNIEFNNQAYYLKVKSQKTGRDTRIKLPAHAVEIILRYWRSGQTLFPNFSNSYINKQLKELGKHIQYNPPIIKTRMRRGRPVEIYKDKERKIHYNLSDHITTHTMRRTAITTLLRFGTPEQVVRKISGHAPNSKEFHKYVALTQNYVDEETDKAFEKFQKSSNF